MAITTPQELNAVDRLALRPLLVGRITSMVASYALYVLGGGKSKDENAANLKQWASDAVKSASSVAEQVSWHVLDNPSFKNGGTSIQDEELKDVVENAINNRFVNPLT